MRIQQTIKILGIALLASPLAAGAQGTGRLVEDVIGRVHTEIITLSDLSRARELFMQEIAQECSRNGCTPERREELIKDAETHLVRDLVDQSLMVQHARNLGINVETEVIKYLDRVRVENNLKDMEALEEAVASQGLVFEDWKDAIRKRMLQDELIQREVRPDIPDAEVQAYYDEHKDEFIRDERVFLSEIFCSVEGKPESEVPAMEEKCKTLRRRVIEGGEDFAKIANAYSDGSTAPQGGDLGGNGFGQDDLAPELWEAVARLKRGEMTDVIRVESGFLILRLNHKYEKGLQPVENVKGEIMNRLYTQKLRPTLREYLTELRKQYYVMLKPGYVDTEGVEATPIIEIAAANPDDEEEPKKKRKWYWPF